MSDSNKDNKQRLLDRSRKLVEESIVLHRELEIELEGNFKVICRGSLIFCRKCGTTEDFDVVAQTVAGDIFYAKHRPCGLEYKPDKVEEYQ